MASERSFAASRDLDLTTAATPHAQGDASNAQGLLNQRGTATSYVLGSVSENTTIDGLYGLTVSHVGGRSCKSPR